MTVLETHGLNSPKVVFQYHSPHHRSLCTCRWWCSVVRVALGICRALVHRCRRQPARGQRHLPRLVAQKVSQFVNAYKAFRVYSCIPSILADGAFDLVRPQEHICGSELKRSHRWALGEFYKRSFWMCADVLLQVNSLVVLYAAFSRLLGTADNRSRPIDRLATHSQLFLCIDRRDVCTRG